MAEKFLSRAEGGSEKSRATAEVEAMSTDNIEDVKRMEKDGIFTKLGKNPWVQRLALVAGILAGGSEAAAKYSVPEGVDSPETWLRDQQKVERSVEATREHIGVLKSTLEASMHSRRSKAKYVGVRNMVGEVEQYELKLSDRPETLEDGRTINRTSSAITNKFFTAIRDAQIESRTGTGKTRYYVDHGSDGSIDRIIIVPGAVGKEDEGAVLLNGVESLKKIAVEAELASVEREAGQDRPALHRVVYDIDAGGNTVTAVEFETGEQTQQFVPHELMDKSPIEVMQMNYEAQAARARAQAEIVEKYAK